MGRSLRYCFKTHTSLEKKTFFSLQPAAISAALVMIFDSYALRNFKALLMDFASRNHGMRLVFETKGI